jgi:hypothetical protein
MYPKPTFLSKPSLITSYNLIITFAIKEQLKDVTHMIYLRIPCYKLYKKTFFLLYSHIKIVVSFWDEFKKKKKTKRQKHEIKN